jgi:hypothetical protein
MFDTAIEYFDAIIASQGDTTASLMAQLNRIYAEWKLKHGEGPQPISGGNFVDTHSTAEYLRRRNDILSQLLSMSSQDEDIQEEIPPPIEKLSAQNFPNPFNPETTIAFSLPRSENVRIEIFNLRGQRVRVLLNDQMERGHHSVLWNGTDSNGDSVGSGIYFYRVQAGSESVTRRMLLLK